jgi:hypothetical protein
MSSRGAKLDTVVTREVEQEPGIRQAICRNRWVVPVRVKPARQWLWMPKLF